MSSDFTSSIGRWVGLGPYYAMFPTDFAFWIVKRYTRTGRGVLDPFCGRGMSVFAAAAQGRHGLGIEINPVGWIYAKTKLNPADEPEVLRRLDEILSLAMRLRRAHDDLPPFFDWAYSKSVRRFLVAARHHLDWRRDSVDRTLMSLILVYLHGKRGQSLSNQLRQAKAMAPEYSIRWWRERGMRPPHVNVSAFMTQRIRWRYRKGTHNFDNSTVYLGDSTVLLGNDRRTAGRKFDLLFTSPPYFGVTNYHYDQWLRLWMLGGTAAPESTGEKWRGRFESRENYEALLERVFRASKPLLTRNAVVYVRTDAREFTRLLTCQVLRRVFPTKSFRTRAQPFNGHTQTALFGDKAPKPGEVDLVLS